MNDTLTTAAELMQDFVVRTDIAGEGPPRRYLWTDAFAVCNCLGLARDTGDPAWEDLALRLIDQVHQVLGRYREDDTRNGWLSGLSDDEARAHPTLGGLRIGKPLPERRPDEPFDERLEWDRDGQYFHYLTRWMHALDQTSRATGDPRYNRWARELALTAYRAFIHRDGEGLPPRMYWKMSTDLRRPLVPSMGQHDPLDGLVAYRQLQATAEVLQDTDSGPDLREALATFEAMLPGLPLTTADPLGLGGLLTDAWRLTQLGRAPDALDEPLIERLLEDAATGLAHYRQSGELQLPAGYRLAFRELGLAIGITAVDRLLGSPAIDRAVRERHAEQFRSYLPLGSSLTAFWLTPANRQALTWTEHEDINAVMLATALQPEGYLDLFSIGAGR
ncbi:MAG: hypothetical protein D6720_04280 [Gammaproteobacteria bacterium]|nr:MAG: hypothetical protein D6720_04280 [Gammaproteobacteria bacterium]